MPQPVDLQTMMEMMRTPGAAGLFWEANQRNRESSQRNAVDLQDVVSQTDARRADSSRKAELHPLEVEGKRLGNQQTGLENVGLGHRNTVTGVQAEATRQLGSEHIVDKAKTDLNSQKQKVFTEGLKEIDSVVALAKRSGPAATAIIQQHLQRTNAPPQMVQQFSQMPPQQAIALLEATSREAYAMSAQRAAMQEKIALEQYAQHQLNTQQGDIKAQLNEQEHGHRLAQIRQEASLRPPAREPQDPNARSDNTPVGEMNRLMELANQAKKAGDMAKAKELLTRAMYHRLDAITQRVMEARNKDPYKIDKDGKWVPNPGISYGEARKMAEEEMRSELGYQGDAKSWKDFEDE